MPPVCAWAVPEASAANDWLLLTANCFAAAFSSIRSLTFWIYVLLFRAHSKSFDSLSSQCAGFLACQWKSFTGALTTASVPYRRWQEFEVANLKLAAFFDEDDLEIKIWIKVFVLLQFFDADPFSLRHILKFLR